MKNTKHGQMVIMNSVTYYPAQPTSVQLMPPETKTNENKKT
jgi:hypothetical protein